MRISDVKAIVLSGGEPSYGGASGFHILVRVETDEGVTGWGEACTHSSHGEAAYAVKTLVEMGFREVIKGENPLAVRKLWEKMYSYSSWYGRRGLAIFAMSGIDLALMDIAGKVYDAPVHDLLGGAFRDNVEVYASILFDMQHPKETAETALKFVNRGFKGVKCGWGLTPETSFGLDISKDIKMLRELRDTLGYDIRLMVDVGRFVHWDSAHAHKAAERYAEFDLFWLEEPLPLDDIEGYISLTRDSEMYIAGGECEYTVHGFRDLVTRNAVDIIQPDITKAGGLSEGKRIFELAELWNRMCVPHSWSTALNTAASLHLVGSARSGFLLEFRAEESPLMDKIVKNSFEVVDGMVDIPDKPGLGVEIDLEGVKKYTVA